MFDVAIVGAGPAGTTCGAYCAGAGLRTLILEREIFPREKVCGDCLNPACWPVLSRLRVADQVRALPHGKLASVDFIGIDGNSISVALPPDAEIAVKRSLFDDLLLHRARELGAEVLDGVTLSALTKAEDWKLIANGEELCARILVAADGRNSTVARFCNLLPRIAPQRVALQTHIPLPRNFGDRIVLQFLPHGYSGQAPVGNGELNLCLVSTAPQISAIKRWAENRFALASTHAWRTITPLTRAAIAPAHPKLFLVGDAARVVEPFTGEGIAYALQSAELAANLIARLIRGEDAQDIARVYRRAQAKLYRGRLWINQLARLAVLHPTLATFAFRLARSQPAILRALTRKIVG